MLARSVVVARWNPWVNTGAVMIPDAWDLGRVQQLVVENELERGRIEYKREVGNGYKVLEAIAALANTFGGVVLVGIDEDQQGRDRLSGVNATERDRLVGMCWSQLTPPFDPQIIPIKLSEDDLYVLAVIVDTDYVRRPVMLNRGNKVVVRLEGQNESPDWYRLRHLFREQPASGQDVGLPPADPNAYIRQGEHPDADLGLRARLLLVGPRGRSHHIAETARAAALAALNSSDAPVTGTGSALISLMHEMCPGGWAPYNWTLDGTASAQQFNARWRGAEPGGRCLTEALFHVKVTPRQGGDTLTMRLDALLTDIRRPAVRENSGGSADEAGSRVPTTPPGPFVGFGALRQLMLEIIGTLWGLPGETLSIAILGQPLGPPAQLDLTVFTVETPDPVYGDSITPPLNARIDFGTARLIPGNTPAAWTRFGPIEPGRTFLSRAEQAHVVHDWLIRLGIDNGYQNVEQEATRWTGIPTS